MKVQMFCFRGSHVYGIGSTPEYAVASAREEGLSLDRVAKGQMCRLPDGVQNVWVDDFGTLCWDYYEGITGKDLSVRPTQLYFNASTKKWQEEKVENPEPTDPDHVVKIVIEGYLNVRAPTAQEALDMVTDVMNLKELAEELSESCDYDLKATNVKYGR